MFHVRLWLGLCCLESLCCIFLDLVVKFPGDLPCAGSIKLENNATLRRLPNSPLWKTTVAQLNLPNNSMSPLTFGALEIVALLLLLQRGNSTRYRNTTVKVTVAWCRWFPRLWCVKQKRKNSKLIKCGIVQGREHSCLTLVQSREEARGS